MRIGFDLRPFLKQETGVGVYLRNLLLSLAQMDQSNEYFLFSASLKDRFPRSQIPPFSEKRFLDLPLPVKMMNFFWHKFSWPPLDYFFRERLDLTHSPSPLILPTKGKKIVTVHDLFFMDFPGLVDREARRDFATKAAGSLLNADGVIAVSRFTRSQLLERLAIDEKRVRVIYHSLDPVFLTDVSPEETEEIEKRYSLPSSFILCVGALEPRKNLLNLIEALKTIHKKHKRVLLVIVGRTGPDYKRLERKIRKDGLDSWVRVMGYLPFEELRGLYRLATVFVFPSLCEGFGLPLLEAMACDLPIASSRVSSLPEIAQDAALYFHPEEPEDMADCIIRLLRDEGLRQSLIAKGKRRVLDFDWRVTAVETLRFYQSVVKSG